MTIPISSSLVVCDQCSKNYSILSLLKTKIATNMPTTKPIVVFSELRPLLTIITLLNAENFQGNRRDVSANICKMIVCGVIVVLIPINVFFGLWFCVNHKFNLEETAMPISVALYVTDRYLNYVSFTTNNRLIISTLTRLQDIITKRK